MAGVRRLLGLVAPRWTVLVLLGCAVGGLNGCTYALSGQAQADLAEAGRLRDAGRYGEALAQGERALALWDSMFGSAHRGGAACFELLGDLHRRQGNYARAEALLRRAYSTAEVVFGEKHPLVTTTLNDFALLYRDQGLYDQAEPLYQRVLARQEAALGQHHPQVAATLNDLAGLYVEQGLYERAEPLHQRALAIREAAFGKNHPDVASSLDNLADLYMAQRSYERAEPLYQRALAMQKATLGKNHPDVARSLNNLADLYLEQGGYEQAEPLLQRALAIREATLGANSPGVAQVLDNLASLYATQGLYGRAELLQQRALAIEEATLDKSHPLVASSLTHLALLRVARNHLAEALPLLTRALTLSERRFRREALGFSGSHLASFLQYLHRDEELLYSLLRAHPGDVFVRRLVLTAVLLRKGRSVEETANTSRTVYRSLGREDREAFERLRALRTQLSTLSLQGPGTLPPADYRQRLKGLADQGDALEAELSKRSAPLRALTALPPPGDILDRVAASLPKDGALVEFVAYAGLPLGFGTPRSPPPAPRYLALVLFPDARIRALDLGPASPIDFASAELRDAFARRDAAYLAPAQALYSLAFRPLLPRLGGVHRLFLAPDGQLGLVPFAALHDGHGFLVDTFDFTYLTSGRELLPRPQDIPPASSVVVFADPDFSAPPASPGDAPTLAERSYPVERFFSTLRAELTGLSWSPLPGTRQEAEAIQRLLPRAQLFLGPDATKDRLLRLSTPGVLHLATHGFFLEDAAAAPGGRGVGHFGALGAGAPTQGPSDPLLRSGLVLAGARAPGAKADGVWVTALELAGLNLWGTELVVLSACDTGRGDVKLGQGIYGLRRALVVAGAETVVMSLWKVNDDTTRLLMDAYYRNLLAGQGRATALRDAMQAVRQGRPHPYDWAPFIALGRDAPLRALASATRQQPDRELSPPSPPGGEGQKSAGGVAYPPASPALPGERNGFNALRGRNE